MNSALSLVLDLWAEAISRDDAKRGPEAAGAALSAALRRFPFWAAGHVRLARVAIALKDFKLAQASLAAAQILTAKAGAVARPELTLLQGTLALRMGYPERAIELLKSLQVPTRNRAEFAEELAAAHLALGARTEAISALQTVPEASLSPQARILLNSL